MSALGQKLPRRLTTTVAALPPKAATTIADGRVRYGPIGNIASSKIYEATNSLFVFIDESSSGFSSMFSRQYGSRRAPGARAEIFSSICEAI
jgi:hypothetical protein